MSETAQCERFVRNAWKKDLCSNCFKGKEEHPAKKVEINRIIPNLPDPPKEGILRGYKSKNSSKFNKVIFPETEFVVIGYGGDDVFSDDDDIPDFTDDAVKKEEADTEEEKAIQRLTKANTEYNSIPSNLEESPIGEVKKAAEPLRLGKQLVDNAGNKKTLVVQVTPFGGQSAVSENPRGKLIAKKDNETSTEVKRPVFQKVEEVKTQPLQENGESDTMEQAVTEVAVTKVSEIGIKRSQPLDKNFKYRPNKDCGSEDVQNKETLESSRVTMENKLNDKLTTSGKVATLLDKAKKKVHHLSTLGDQPNFKYSTIEYLPAANKTHEKNKGVVLDMFDLREDVKSISDQVDSVTIPRAPSPTMSVTAEVKITPTIVFETKKDIDIANRPVEASNKSKPLPNVSSLHRPAKIGVREPNTSADVPDLVQNVPEMDATKAIKTETENSPKNDCSNSDYAQSLKCDKLENFEKIIGGEEVTIFSMDSQKVNEDVVTRCAPDSGSGDYQETFVCKPTSIEPSPEKASPTFDEPPALPSSPPPTMDPRTSFLHQLTNTTRKVLGEKPKVPAKPVLIMSKKQLPIFSPRPKSPSMETFLDGSPVPRAHPPLTETLSDSGKKRPAPQPPSPKDESALIRGARSSENLLELARAVASGDCSPTGDVPSPVPRRSMSLSQDSLLHSGVSDIQSKKKSNRGRFSLRKLLHLGKNKETNGREVPSEAQEPAVSSPRPKPEIIHPLDLTGARIEVVPPQKPSKTRRTSSSASSSSGEHRESDILSDSSTTQSLSSSGTDGQPSLERNRKPPPPPRNLSLDQSNKPARPPPPKASPEARREQRQEEREPIDRPRDNYYVNLGEVRSSLAPSKPQRTGSLREVDVVKKLVPVSSSQDAEMKKQLWTGSLRYARKPNSACGPPEDSGYESFDVSLSTTDSQTSSLTAEDNVYECVQVGMPSECETPIRDGTLRGLRNNRLVRGPRRSDGNLPDVAQDYIKMRFLRSVSVPYCASEAESDIYSPYSFCGSEMGDEEYEWSPTSGRLQKVSRLKLKKGRSIVHKSLEDNYGAVVVANHEALSQVVEQMHQGPVTPPALRGLSVVSNLRWSDFSVVKDGGGVVVEHRVFYSALWGLHPVTLCLAPEHEIGQGFYGKSPFSLSPIAELHDLVPSSLLSGGVSESEELVQSSISVLSRIQIDTLQNYSRNISSPPLTDETKKEINFILLQIINALKTLQAQGIEEAPRGLRNLVVTRDERDPYPRVCVLPGTPTDCTSLCACLLDLLTTLSGTDLAPLLTATLREEKAVSLSRAKSLLEYTIWGPVDISFGSGAREAALQRWLDLERATVLHGLVRTRADLNVFEEWHLLFLVRTNAKMMMEASLLIEAQSAN